MKEAHQEQKKLILQEEIGAERMHFRKVVIILSIQEARVGIIQDRKGKDRVHHLKQILVEEIVRTKKIKTKT